MFKVDNKDTRAMSMAIIGILLVSLLLKLQSYEFGILAVISLTFQNNVSKKTHSKTIKFVSCLTLKFRLQIKKTVENVKK